MTAPQSVIVYVVVWWLLFFMALPIGVGQSDNANPAESRGAPQRRFLLVKCACVSAFAFAVTWGIDIVIHSGIVAVK